MYWWFTDSYILPPHPRPYPYLEDSDGGLVNLPVHEEIDEKRELNKRFFKFCVIHIAGVSCFLLIFFR